MPGFRKKIAKISGFKREIATLESGHYSPGHIDKAITEIGNNITELKGLQRGGNDSLIRHYTKQKKSFRSRFGSNARRISPPGSLQGTLAGD